MSYDDHTPEDEELNKIAGRIVGLFVGGLLAAFIILYLAPQVSNWYETRAWIAEHPDRTCTHHGWWHPSDLRTYWYVRCTKE